MQHEDTGVDLGWLRVGSSVQDIGGEESACCTGGVLG